MAICFQNNIFCCYLPAHTSHGLQPLDNGPFNALKAAYRKELSQYSILTDSTPMDKINFIRAYAKAQQIGLTQKNCHREYRCRERWRVNSRESLSADGPAAK